MPRTGVANWLTRKQAADWLGVTLRTVDRWRRQGKLQGTEVGGRVRFRPEDLRALIGRGPQPRAEGKQCVLPVG